MKIEIEINDSIILIWALGVATGCLMRAEEKEQAKKIIELTNQIIEGQQK